MSLRSKISLTTTLLVLAAVVVTTLLQTIAGRQAVLEQARVGGDEIADLLSRAAGFAEDVPSLVEEEIAEQMKVEATLAAHLVALGEEAGLPPERIEQALSETAGRFGLEILATDEEGLAYLTTADIRLSLQQRSPGPATGTRLLPASRRRGSGGGPGSADP